MQALHQIAGITLLNLRTLPQRLGTSLVVVVGDYTQVKDQLTGFGDIQIVDVSGKPIPAPQ